MDWNDMKLIHYTDKEFELKPKNYEQKDLDWHAKPNGFWFSVEGEYDWKWWCESEKFYLEKLAVCYEIELKEDAKILHLKKDEEILNLSNLYFYIKPQWNDPEGRKLCGTYEIYWEKIKQEYQGIIIAPYQWNCRINHLCDWYYGWDCASGCIWDLSCIKEIRLIENEK